VRRDGDILSAPATPRGQHVRAQGLDFKRGDALLQPGARLDGVSLSLAAAAGRAALQVRVRPRIALFGTGDEIVAPGNATGPDDIYDSVSYGLAALVESWGGAATRLHPRGDDVGVISAAAREALTHHDLLVTIGGASVGDHDLVKPALSTLQLKLVVEKVNMRPGKPVWFGLTELGPVLGLPGNPASALVCAHLFLKPLIARLLGGGEAMPAFSRALLDRSLPANGPREHYLRARLALDGEARARVAPFEQQDSSLLSVFRDANALIRIAAGAPALPAGALVDVLSLER
jgi:molybdopterin molybdotransferase